MDANHAPKGPEKRGPLHGIRVIDLSSLIFGPYATQILGDLGAEVIKVEPPGGDRIRVELKHRDAKNKDMGSLFMAVNRNKKSVTLDLKQEGDRESLRALIVDAHVFIHNVRAVAIGQLGFSYEEVARINPSIVYVHCAGYGSDGPYAGRQAMEDLVQAASGAADTMRDEQGESMLRMIPGFVVDKVSGLHALYATLAALLHRERTGEGQFVEVPMFESFTAFLMVEHLYGATFEPAVGRVGAPPAMSAARAVLRSLDGHIAVLPQGRAANEKFLELGGIPDFYGSAQFKGAASSTERIDLYNRAMRQAAAARTTEEWMELGEAHRIAIMRANTLDTVLDDPHLTAVDFFQVRAHESEGAWRATKPPVRFSKTPTSIRREPPRAGADTAEVLAGISPLVKHVWEN